MDKQRALALFRGFNLRACENNIPYLVTTLPCDHIHTIRPHDITANCVVCIWLIAHSSYAFSIGCITVSHSRSVLATGSVARIRNHTSSCRRYSNLVPRANWPVSSLYWNDADVILAGNTYGKSSFVHRSRGWKLFIDASPGIRILIRIPIRILGF